jgi:hypothetical protein
MWSHEYTHHTATELGDISVRVAHRVQPEPEGGTTITYAVEVTAPSDELARRWGAASPRTSPTCCPLWPSAQRPASRADPSLSCTHDLRAINRGAAVAIPLRSY